MGRFHEIFIGDVSMTIDMDCIVLGYIYKQKVGPTGAADHIYIYTEKDISWGYISWDIFENMMRNYGFDSQNCRVDDQFPYLLTEWLSTNFR
jgi:hypothetical protein